MASDNSDVNASDDEVSLSDLCLILIVMILLYFLDG